MTENKRSSVACLELEDGSADPTG